MAMYKWREGSRFAEKKISAQAVGERIEELRESLGGFVKPEAVVDDARSPNSPLHPAFEWDDSKAAGEHRLQQARTLIRSVAVRIETGDQVKTFRAFVSVESDDEKRYTNTVSAMGDEEMRKQILQRAWQDLQNWRRRYSEIKEISEIVALADQLESVFAKVA